MRILIASLAIVVSGCASTPPAATPAPTIPVVATMSAAATSAASTIAPTEAATPSPRATLPSTTEVATKAPADAIAIEMTPDALMPRFKPDAVTVKAGTATFFLTSVPVSGTFGPHHDMLIGPEVGKPLATSGVVQPGTSAVFTVEGLTPGTYTFWCNTNTGHGPHHTLGMVGTLTVS